MKWMTQWMFAALTIFMLTANAAPAHRSAVTSESSRDLTPDVVRAAPVKTRSIRIFSATETPAPAAGVGDSNSFGRNVRYLGVAQTGTITFSSDCSTVSTEEGDRCVALNPAPSVTTFNEDDLARIDLPANAANSLICFALTPYVDFEFHNGTGVPQSDAMFLTRAQVTVENEVLNDPTVVDSSGFPFGGSFITNLRMYSESRSLAVNERAERSMSLSRDCVGGLLSKTFLTDGLGLTEAQANAFFAHPTTLRFGSTGSVSLLDSGTTYYGIRLYGD